MSHRTKNESQTIDVSLEQKEIKNTITINNLDQQLSNRLQESVQEMLVECVTNAIIGPKTVWLLDKMVSPTVKTTITAMVDKYIKESRPIPLLIAISPCKLPVNKLQLDYSEELFVSTLKSIQQRVQQFYQPGVRIVVRVEDSVLLVLCSELNPEETMKSMSKYGDEFRKLLTKYQVTSFITLVNESSLMSLYEYMGRCYQNTRLFENYLNVSEPLFLEAEKKQQAMKEKKEYISSSLDKEQKTTDMLLCELQSCGWQNGVSMAFRRYNYERYKKFYPNSTEEFRKEHFARYLSCIMTRKQLKGYGNDKSWNYGHIDISLVPPAPDALKTNNRLYYRSIPKDICYHAQPFWKIESKVDQETGTIKFEPKNVG